MGDAVISILYLNTKDTPRHFIRIYTRSQKERTNEKN